MSLHMGKSRKGNGECEVIGCEDEFALLIRTGGETEIDRLGFFLFYHFQ